MDGWIVGWMNGWKDGRMAGLKNKHKENSFFFLPDFQKLQSHFLASQDEISRIRKWKLNENT